MSSPNYTWYEHEKDNDIIIIIIIIIIAIIIVIIITYWFRLILLNLTLNPLTCKICWAPNNSSKWQMGNNWAFEGLIHDYNCNM